MAALRQLIGEDEGYTTDPISQRGAPWLFFLSDWAGSGRNLPLPVASEAEERLGVLRERRGQRTSQGRFGSVVCLLPQQSYLHKKDELKKVIANVLVKHVVA